MPSPFPGFDPYLEDVSLWRGFHGMMMSEMTRELNRILPPGFFANMDERVLLAPIGLDVYPDVALLRRPSTPATSPSRSASGGMAVLDADPSYTLTRLIDEDVEKFVEVRVTGSKSLVSVIEVLSPTNKTFAGYGRDLYRRKQEQLLAGGIHLLEIDLLRSGLDAAVVERAVARHNGQTPCDYLVCLSRAAGGRIYEYWPIGVRSRLPRVRVPLTDTLPDVILDLQACFDSTYNGGPYTRGIDYKEEPEPPLTGDDAAWADELLRAKGLR